MSQEAGHNQAERHRRSKELFLELCRLPRSEQEEHLSKLDDPRELIAEVESLLGFFEEPEVDELEPTRPLQPAPNEGSSFAPGTIIGDRYRIVRRLAKGGMGTLFEAEDLTLHSHIALKFLHPATKSQHLLNEVRLARQVTHPNVCRVYDLGELDGVPFISMEYVDGEDLHSLLTRIGRLPRNRTVVLARQLFSGLAAAHAKGVLHRDLKPANIMINGRGEVRITDFGIALDTRDSSKEKSLAGTPAFMAPEVLDGMAPTEKSDLYAMGILLYEMCTGVYPFEAQTRAEHRDARYSQRPLPPSSRVDDLDPLLERVILKCLEISPTDRPSSALAVAAALPGVDDPLTLAVSIGETPSPEMVADAGNRGVMESKAAMFLAGLTLFFLSMVALISDSTRRSNQIDLALPPEVLVEKAREKLRAFGWNKAPKDSAYGFLENHFALGALRPRDLGPEGSSAPGTSSILFWYRQSPEVMEPSGLNNLVALGGRISTYDPPQDKGGMAMVLLHPSGTLEQLEIYPELEEDTLEDPPSEPDRLPLDPFTEFSELLIAAGLDPARMEAQPAIFAPPFFADRRGAFIGTTSERPDLELEIRTASYRNRPVYFRMLPKSDETEAAKSSWLLSLIDEWNEWWDLIFVASACIAIPLMRRNLRRGRGDQRSAQRLAAFVFAVMTFLWLLRGPHVADVGTEWMLTRLRLGTSLLQAGLVWLLYLAIEPYVRRIWPQALIAWTRLLAGRFQDPLVGSSALYGVAIGSGWALLGKLDTALPKWLGIAAEPQPVRASPFDYALTVRETLAGLGDHLILGIHDAVFSLILIVLLRLVLPRPWAAALAYVALVTALYAHEGAHPLISWLTAGLAIAVTEVFTLMRFGLMTYAVAAFSANVLAYSPITLDVSAWYAGSGFTGIGVLLLILGGAMKVALQPHRTRTRSLSTSTHT